MKNLRISRKTPCVLIKPAPSQHSLCWPGRGWERNKEVCAASPEPSIADSDTKIRRTEARGEKDADNLNRWETTAPQGHGCKTISSPFYKYGHNLHLWAWEKVSPEPQKATLSMRQVRSSRELKPHSLLAYWSVVSNNAPGHKCSTN